MYYSMQTTFSNRTINSQKHNIHAKAYNSVYPIISDTKKRQLPIKKCQTTDTRQWESQLSD